MPDLFQHDFDCFWAAFPAGRKSKKAEARRVFISIVTGRHRDLNATPEQLIQGAQRYRAAIGDNYPYVKMPTTWLRAGCWEDDDLTSPSPPGQLLPGRADANGSTRSRSLAQDLLDSDWAK